MPVADVTAAPVAFDDVFGFLTWALACLRGCASSFDLVSGESPVFARLEEEAAAVWWWGSSSGSSRLGGLVDERDKAEHGSGSMSGSTRFNPHP